jgi:hypothetical protein
MVPRDPSDTSQQQVIDHARHLTTAAEDGPGALVELFGCTDAAVLYLSAFGAAMKHMRNLLAIVDELVGRAATDLQEWSTSEQLCAWLGISVKQLYALNWAGKGPRQHRGLGKEIRYRRGDVEKWLLVRQVGE